MAKAKTTCRFWLRSDRLNQDGTAPVHLVYQIKGQRKYYAVPEVKLFPLNWDADQQRAVFLDKKKLQGIKVPDGSRLLTLHEVNEINEALDGILTRVRAIEYEYSEKGQAVSVQMVVDRLKDGKRVEAKEEAPKSFLFDFLDKYISDHSATREPGSLAVYRSLKNHLQAFQEAKGVRVGFESIDYSFFQAFQSFLIEKRNLNNTTVAKQLSTVKTFLNYARVQGIEVSDRFKDFKIKRDSLEVIALTSEEFETLYQMDLSANKRLDQVRDIFCFACATGLRYSDLDQLKREHIKGTEIKLTVKKTKDPLTIPLNIYSASILKKYSKLDQPLPMISNQKLNAYVKELCQVAGIDEQIEIVRYRGVKREAHTYPKYELIGVHCGRKTFATLSLEKGMSAEEVMSITGHKDYKSFKRYVTITEQRKKTVMAKAWGAAKDINLKAI
jgi:site-specific recombinase XerD